jgi:hypothetical protein
MPGRPSLIARLIAALRGRGGDHVLVLVNTVDGVETVPVRAKDVL